MGKTTDWYDLEGTYYNCLADDYLNHDKNSAYFEQYIADIVESGRKNKGRGSDTKKSAANIIYERFSELKGQQESIKPELLEERIFEFLTDLFELLVKNEKLYSQPISLGSSLPDDDSNHTSIKNVNDFKDILSPIIPFLIPVIPGIMNDDLSKDYGRVLGDENPFPGYQKIKPSLLSDDNISKIQKEIKLYQEGDESRINIIEEKYNKKVYIHGLVLDIFIQMKKHPDEIRSIYKQKGLLKITKKSKIQTLVTHIMLRSANKAFKDFLYSYKYQLVREDDSKEEKVYVAKIGDMNSKESSTSAKKKADKTTQGRAGAKPDKTLLLASKISKKNWMLSFDGFMHLKNRGFKETVVKLFDYIYKKYKENDHKGKSRSIKERYINNENYNVKIDFLLASDNRTGMSLHLLGKYFCSENDIRDLAIKSPCVFAVVSLKKEEEVYTYDYGDDDGSPKIFGVTKDNNDIESLYDDAVLEYRTAIEGIEDIEEFEGSSKETEKSKIDISNLDILIGIENEVDDSETSVLADFVRHSISEENIEEYGENKDIKYFKEKAQERVNTMTVYSNL